MTTPHRVMDNPSHGLTVDQLSALQYALGDVVGYLTDNSCGDPDCCGGPYYEEAAFNEGIALMAQYGLSYMAREP